MIRRLLFEFSLFLAPFAIFFFYRWALLREQKQARLGVRQLQILFFVGVALAVAGFFVQAWWEGQQAQSQAGRYVPSYVKDGRIVPGHWQAIEQPTAPTPPAAGTKLPPWEPSTEPVKPASDTARPPASSPDSGSDLGNRTPATPPAP